MVGRSAWLLFRLRVCIRPAATQPCFRRQQQTCAQPNIPAAPRPHRASQQVLSHRHQTDCMPSKSPRFLKEHQPLTASKIFFLGLSCSSGWEQSKPSTRRRSPMAAPAGGSTSSTCTCQREFHAWCRSKQACAAAAMAWLGQQQQQPWSGSGPRTTRTAGSATALNHPPQQARQAAHACKLTWLPSGQGGKQHPMGC